MKLIELLVKKLGGWPIDKKHHAFIAQDNDGDLWAFPSSPSMNSGWGDWEVNSGDGCYLFNLEVADDNKEAVITREQFEAALAASKPRWDGKFPIPAGTDVEVYFDGDDCRVWTRFRVEFMAGEVVVLHDYRVDDVDAYKHKNLSFRPIRSEADKKRDEAVASIKAILMYDRVDGPKLDDGTILYEAIAAGKIPHIRID